MVIINIDPLPGNTEIVDKLEGMAERGADWKEPFLAIAESFHKMEHARFASEGPGWPALSPITSAYKAYHGYSSMTLGPRTGDLLTSLTSEGPGSVVYTTPFSVFMGTDIPYAHFHQLGMGWNPLRPLVHITEIAVVVWGRLLRDYWIDGEIGEVSGSVAIGML